MATTESRTALPDRLAAPAFVGGLVALAGTYWDDAWHTDRGRDDFFIAPHLTLYGGVLVAAVAVGLWFVGVARSRGVRGALRDERHLRWAVAAAAGVFVSAPLDNMWHSAYGRDAVLFSPPHLLAIVASASLVIALAGGQERPADRSKAIALMAGAGVLGSLLVPVMEYEADVPQFSPAWFLPLVTVAVVLTRPVAARLLPGRWPLTQVAAAYTVVRLALVVSLAAAGFSTPIVPPILVAAAVADLASVRRWSWPVQAATVTAAVHAAYLPWLAVVPHGVPVAGRDVLISLALAFVGAAAAQLAVSPLPRLPRGAALGASAVVLVLAALIGNSPPASAHDPGQGELRGDARLTATVEDRTIHLDATITGVDCDGLADANLVARRAGMTRSAPLEHRRGCDLAGRVSVPENGRWFVYATFDDRNTRLETWLPVEVADGTDTSATRDLYQPPSSPDRGTQALVGAVLLLIATSLLVGTLRSVAADKRVELDRQHLPL
jgi:hypothetical protein